MKVLIGANPMGLEKMLPPCGEDPADVTFVHEPDCGNLLKFLNNDLPLRNQVDKVRRF
jgi:hypothetical protein